MMTDEQFRSELSQEYLEWSTGPSLDISGPVEEIQRLCEVIVGLRARIAELEGVERTARRLGYEDGYGAAVREQAAELERLRKALCEEIAGRTLRPFEDAHEDHGECLWWRAPVCEPPAYTGSTNEVDFPEDEAVEDNWYFTRVPNPLEPSEAAKLLAGYGVKSDRAPAQAEPRVARNAQVGDEVWYCPFRTMTSRESGRMVKVLSRGQYEFRIDDGGGETWLRDDSFGVTWWWERQAEHDRGEGTPR